MRNNIKGNLKFVQYMLEIFKRLRIKGKEDLEVWMMDSSIAIRLKFDATNQLWHKNTIMIWWDIKKTYEHKSLYM